MSEPLVSDSAAGGAWVFHRFGLLVTGKGEELFLQAFLRVIAATGNCTFEIVRRIPQRNPVTSARRVPQLRVTGSGKRIPSKDVSEIGLPARNYLQRHRNSCVILVDDLERDRRHLHQQTFERYRSAFDAVLPERCRKLVSVHFLVYMIEAYYFAHAEAVNAVLGTSLRDFDGDVETIPNPKADLKRLAPGFDEITDGRKIVERLDLYKVLDNRDTCASLRTLVKWCCHAMGEVGSDKFQLRSGRCSPVTEGQLV